MKFQALEISLAAIRALRRPLRSIQVRDRRLAEHLRAAASSVALNLGEGRRRSGKDRLHHFRIAAGSADEALTSLRVAEAWGYVAGASIEKPFELLDRVLAILWSLTR